MESHSWGKASSAKLDNCHPDLRRIAVRALVLSPYDITIIHTFRGAEAQNALFASHASTKKFPNSRHNKSNDPKIDNPQTLSDAIDFAPWINGVIPWGDTHIFAVIAGSFFAAANDLDLTLRWGGDWNGNGSTRDQKLMDWGHIEIMH